MRVRFLICTVGLLFGMGLLPPADAHAQVLRGIKRAAQNAAQREVEARVARLVTNAVRCALDDFACVERAKADGEDVIFVDDSGTVVTDEDGAPITDPEKARRAAPPFDRPGEGVWAGYDFITGENILFYDDWTSDDVGDFPHRLELVRGNWDVVEWQGQRLLRNTGPTNSAVVIPLPETLPEQFTIELEAHLADANQRLAIAAYSAISDGTNAARFEENYFKIGANEGSGLEAASREYVESVVRTEVLAERVMPVRIMVNGRYAKIYVGSQRVANVPNATIRRGNALFIQNTNFADQERPIYLGAIRVATRRDVYEDIADDGRAVTRGILFATNSDRIRAESTPMLEEIGDALREHPDLQLRIECHTADVGDGAASQDLSERRAAAVRTYLIEHGIAADRLESAGLGASQPLAPNTGPEGRERNQRVELVRLTG